MSEQSHFSRLMLKPQTEDQLLNANYHAKEQVKQFFLNFSRFNAAYAADPTTAKLPESTCLIVKGPPGCGKTETVEFFMRQFHITPSYTFSMASER